MNDLSRRDILLGTAAVVATASLPAAPAAEFPAVNEIVACVERQPEAWPETVTSFRWVATYVYSSPEDIISGHWTLTEPSDDA